MKRIFIENDLIVKIVTVALAITITIVIMIVASKAEGSGVPIVGLSEEQLQRLRDVPGVEVSVNALREERDIPPDIEVEWKVVVEESSFPIFVLGIPWISINREGEVRVVDGHPKYLMGARIWLSKDEGKTWVLEKECSNPEAKDRAAFLGEEEDKIIFGGFGTRPFADWPRETENIIKERFIRHFRHHETSFASPLFARDPKNPEKLFFVISGTGYGRLFVSLDNGKNWIEISAPRYATVCSVAISSRGDKLRLWVGTDYKDLLQCAVLDINELKKVQEKLFIQKKLF